MTIFNRTRAIHGGEYYASFCVQGWKTIFLRIY